MIKLHLYQVVHKKKNQVSNNLNRVHGLAINWKNNFLNL